MRVLLLSYYFPPDPEVGGVRPARWARYLAAAGHDVHVLTIAGSQEKAAAVRLEPGLTLHRVQPWRSPRSLLQSLFAADSEAREPNDGRNAPGAEAPTNLGLRRAVRKTVLSLVWTPDDKQGYIGAAVGYGAELVARRSLDLIYMTGPPWSVHVAGLLLRGLTGLPLVAEYRDPWSPTTRVAEMNHGVAVTVKRSLQRRSLAAADLVVTVTEGIADYVRPFADKPVPFVTAVNGLDGADVGPRRQPATGPIRIVHAGEVYYGRDPRPFLEAVATVRRARSLGPADLQVLFLGNGRYYRGVALEELTHDLGIDDVVQFHDQVPFAECRRVLAEADALLLLAQKQPRQIPNKLFDYLVARRPILGFVDQDGESERILRRLVGHEVVTDWMGPGAARAVGAILDRARSIDLDPSEPALVDLTSERQFARLLSKVESVVGSSISTGSIPQSAGT